MIALLPGRSVLLIHFTRSLLTRTLLCAGILVSLMEILGLLEMTTPILERHLGVAGLLYYALLRLPTLASQTLPLATLIGALFLLMQMTLASEMASLRAAGLSTRRLIRLLLPGVALISLTGIVLDEIAIPHSELALARWWNATDPDATTANKGLWFHEGPAVVHIDGYSDGGRTIHRAALYHRAAGGELTFAQTAPVLHFVPGTGWQAGAVRTLTLRSDKIVVDFSRDAVLLPAVLTPDRLIQLSQPYPMLPLWDIWRILHRGAASSLPKATYRMAFFAPFCLPISLVAMLLLALPVIYIPPRTGTRSILPVATLAAGFGFMVLQGLIQALGNAGTLPALVAVVAAPTLAFLLGGAWIVKMEDQ